MIFAQKLRLEKIIDIKWRGQKNDPQIPPSMRVPGGRDRDVVDLPDGVDRMTVTLMDHCIAWYTSQGITIPPIPDLQNVFYECWVNYAFADFKEIA
jgi:hypothetical protein